MNTINGIPLIWNKEEDNQLFGQIAPFLRNPNNSSLSSLATYKSFDEITFDKKVGEDYKCSSCKNDFYEGLLNLNLLISDLRERQRFDNDFFYYQKYTQNLPKVVFENANNDSFSASPYVEVEKSVPFEYTDPKTKKRVVTKFKVGLNTRACLVSYKQYGFKTLIDAKNKSLRLYVEYIYTDSLDKKMDIPSTENPNDYEIEDKYIAIKLETNNFNDFFALAKEIDLYEHIKIKIKNLFVSKIKATTNAKELDFLYENCPDEIIEIIKRNQEISEEKIWSDLVAITSLDSEKWFTDTSSALLNALKLIGYSDLIYYKFVSSPELVKTIYNNLDGKSLVNGQMMSNKSIFASFITALCIHNSFKGLHVLNKDFTIGKDYAISSGNLFQKEKDDEFFLQQMQKVVKTETINQIDGPFIITTTSLEEVEKGNLYHPMDIVRLNYADSKENPFPFVSAMTIKNFAEERDQQLRIDAIRIGFDVLAIVLSVVFFPAGGAVGIIAESVGIGLALADIGITANREEIMQDPGGREFLEAWDQVYFVGGLTLASVALVEQVFAKSMFCYLNAIKNKSSLFQMYERSLGEILLKREILTFAGNTLKPDTEITLKILAYNSDKIPKATAFVFNKYNNILQLYEKGAVLVEIGEKEYALVYKGEKLIQGKSNDKKLLEFYRKLKKKISKNSKKLEEALEETSQTIKYENGRMGYVDGLYDGIEVNYKPNGFDFEDTLLHDNGIGYQTKIYYENVWGYFRRHFVNKTKTFIFDHAFPLNLPGWIKDVKVPLVQGKGIPTHVYFTLRQMKLLDIAEGEIQMVKMSQIQNLDTAAFIYQATGGKTIRTFDSVDILAAPSNEYMKTVMTQAGYETLGGRITGKGIYRTVKQLKDSGFELNPKYKDYKNPYEVFMKDNGLSWDSKLYTDYNIEVKVKYVK